MDKKTKCATCDTDDFRQPDIFLPDNLSDDEVWQYYCDVYLRDWHSVVFFHEDTDASDLCDSPVLPDIQKNEFPYKKDRIAMASRRRNRWHFDKAHAQKVCAILSKKVLKDPPCFERSWGTDKKTGKWLSSSPPSKKEVLNRVRIEFFSSPEDLEDDSSFEDDLHENGEYDLVVVKRKFTDVNSAYQRQMRYLKSHRHFSKSQSHEDVKSSKEVLAPLTADNGSHSVKGNELPYVNSTARISCETNKMGKRMHGASKMHKASKDKSGLSQVYTAPNFYISPIHVLTKHFF